VEINIINPHTTRRRKFKCASCGVTYSKSDYKILYDARKIIYFEIPTKKKSEKTIMICHECFYNYVVSLFSYKENRKKKFIRVTMIDGDKKYNCKFYPNRNMSFLDEMDEN
jgi:DNA-directed RNA polymerase subunit M/transcription elongation factor TFIIS